MGKNLSKDFLLGFQMGLLDSIIDEEGGTFSVNIAERVKEVPAVKKNVFIPCSNHTLCQRGAIMEKKFTGRMRYVERFNWRHRHIKLGSMGEVGKMIDILQQEWIQVSRNHLINPKRGWADVPHAKEDD